MMQTKVGFLIKATLYPVGTFLSSLHSKVFILKGLLVYMLLMCTNFTFSQQVDSTKKENSHFGGAVSLTTKGISTIPSFTLGKPAVIFDLFIGKKRLSFEPQFRFALEGKPWSFLF